MNKIERQRKKRKVNKEFAVSFLGGRCAACGSAERLEFDHIARDRKHCISELLSSSRDTLMEELVKCQLLCRNCHRDKTLSELNQRKTGTVHGSLTNYSHGKCRCEACKKVWNEKTKEYKRRAKVAQLVRAPV